MKIAMVQSIVVVSLLDPALAVMVYNARRLSNVGRNDKTLALDRRVWKKLPINRHGHSNPATMVHVEMSLTFGHAACEVLVGIIDDG
eukprot:scaffold7091_cov273-Chaetoceros_neogracile.AAC.2